MARNFALKLYRTFFVIPPAASFQILRNKFTARRVESGLPEVEHPIDQQYGIDTSGGMGFEQLGAGTSSDVFNTAYFGSQPSIIRQAIRMLPDQHGLTFMDIGCGKGRALAVASEFPFRRIIGVELASSLAKVARANAELVGRRFPDRTTIDVVEGDALTTAIPEGPLVIYMYHPFFRKLMKKLVRKVENWLAGSKSKVYVIYYNPMFPDLYDKSKRFRRVYAGMMDIDAGDRGTGPTYAADAVVIWQSVGEPMLEPHPQAAAARVEMVVPGWQTRVVS